MNVTVSGWAWTLGNDINADVLAPGAYVKLPMEQAALYCLQSIEPEFSRSVSQGDIIVAGFNFGLGANREQAVQALKFLGVGAILARSFSRVFYRDAINLGLPALLFPWADEIATGDRLVVDPMAGDVRNVTTGHAYRIEPIPRHVMRIINDGGLMPHLKKKLARQRMERQLIDDTAQ